MSYQALARKWRPKNFTEVVGQVHIVTALSNALDQERIHHAYLFTGTRGVGKTTLARIFAKCLNCEQGVKASPCGECGSCQEIDEGRFIDLIEVDAASRTKVEDTRELLDNVQYSPTRGRFKVYLIDEVHMLSGHSFNALLKTLEEPPPHVKFLLATTDPQKVPITVLSRCLQFNLKRVSDDAIATHLEKLMQAENIQYEKSALISIAHAADGSLRDGLSLLDQAIAFTDSNVNAQAVSDMLGTVPNEYLQKLMRAMVNKNAEEIMQCTHELAQLSADFNSLFEDIINVLHQSALLQAVPGIEDTIEQNKSLIEELSEKLQAEDLQLFYQIALMGKRDAYLSATAQSALEMTLLRMLSFRPAEVDSKKNFENRMPVESVPRRTEEKNLSKELTSKVANISNFNDLAEIKESWSKLVENLNLQGVSYSLASNCSVNNIADNILNLNLTKQHEGIATENAKKKLESALQEYFDNSLILKIEITENHENETPAMQQDRAKANKISKAEQTVEQDQVVQALKKQFGAEIIEGSVKPIDK